MPWILRMPSEHRKQNNCAFTIYTLKQWWFKATMNGTFLNNLYFINQTSSHTWKIVVHIYEILILSLFRQCLMKCINSLSFAITTQQPIYLLPLLRVWGPLTETSGLKFTVYLFENQLSFLFYDLFWRTLVFPQLIKRPNCLAYLLLWELNTRLHFH